MKGLLGANPERIKADFMKLANKFTGGELTDEILTRASEKLAARPRTAEMEMTKEEQ